MKLSIRLKKICDLVHNVDTLADIGCDHGKVVANLFQEGKIKYAYLSDISAPSVQKADNLLKEIGVSADNYKVMVTDGLTNFDAKHIDMVIIAGMGGLEIKKILSENMVDVDTFVLGPNNNDVILRKYLLQNNYKIDTDLIVKDANKYYNIMKVTRGKSKLPKLNLYFGFTNFDNITDDFKDYLEYEKSKTSSLIDKVPFMKKYKYRKYLRLIDKAINKITRGL